MSCLAVEKPTVTLIAIQKQEAAKWYFKKKDYEKAAELCEAAIASWERVEKAKLKVTPDWNIEFNIVQCRELLNKCKTRMAFVDEDKGKDPGPQGKDLY